MQAIFAGAATVATLALFSAARPADAGTSVASGSASLLDQLTGRPAPPTPPSGPQTAPSMGGDDSVVGPVISVDDDTNPSSGDIFTQNAQDQSTA
jgi:hypothetical protein